jgi:ion channel-forming bestrophin family protein
MITYNPKDWFTFIFRLHKTETMIKLWPLLLGVGLYSAGWAYIETVLFKDYKSVAMASNIGIIYSILGFTLSLFLVFRTNTAYDRWWDGRKLWGELTNAIRNLCIHLNAILPADDITKRCWACFQWPCDFTCKTEKSLHTSSQKSPATTPLRRI